MSVERVSYFIVTCDRCGTVTDPPGSTMSEARLHARSEGWSRSRRRAFADDLCPVCSKALRSPQSPGVDSKPPSSP